MFLVFLNFVLKFSWKISVIKKTSVIVFFQWFAELGIKKACNYVALICIRVILSGFCQDTAIYVCFGQLIICLHWRMTVKYCLTIRKSNGCLGLLWFIRGKTDDRLGRVMMGEWRITVCEAASILFSMHWRIDQSKQNSWNVSFFQPPARHEASRKQKPINHMPFPCVLETFGPRNVKPHSVKLFVDQVHLAKRKIELLQLVHPKLMAYQVSKSGFRADSFCCFKPESLGRLQLPVLQSILQEVSSSSKVLGISLPCFAAPANWRSGSCSNCSVVFVGAADDGTWTTII